MLSHSLEKYLQLIEDQHKDKSAFTKEEIEAGVKWIKTPDHILKENPKWIGIGAIRIEIYPTSLNVEYVPFDGY